MNAADAFLDDLVERIAAATAARLAELLPRQPAPQSMAPAPSAYLTTKGAAAYLALSTATLESWRAKGKGPRPTKCGNAVRYSRAELDRWVAANTKGSAK